MNRVDIISARSKVILAGLIALVVLFSFFMFTGSGIVTGTDVATDLQKKAAISEAYRKTVIEGSIVDSNNAEITRAEELGVPAKCYHNSYAYLVGYHDSVYGTMGLRGRYEKYLFMNGRDDRGATIRLTTLNDLQDYVYKTISDINGSAVVLDAHTSRILALASHNTTTFDLNDLRGRMGEYNQIDSFFYAYGFRDYEPPGSTFKIVTAAAMLENDMESMVYTDTGTAEYDGVKIHNASDAVYGEVDMREAFCNSVNTYFATAAVKLGKGALEDKASDFMIGESIPLDFTTLNSNFDLGIGTRSELAQAGFGQGNTQVTPLHIAMIVQSVANDGVMMKPYLVDEVTLNDTALLKGRKQRLCTPIKKATAKKLTDIMQYTAREEYGFDPAEFGSIGAKTGTAELANGKYHAYFASFSDDYVVVISENNTSKHGSSLKERAKDIYRYLEQEMQ